jgi:peptide/nickel transport system substrate-binding protein
LDKDTFPNGPTYFNDFLDLQGYTTVSKDTSADKLGLKAIDTPDDTTIVFHLKTSFAGFDYFAMLPSTVPVPQKADTGTKYKEHVVSSGPYMFDTNVAGQSFSLKRNPNWDAATDPYRAALPDRVEVKLKMNAEDIDKQLQNGTLDVDVAGTGVQQATQATLLANDANKKNVDTAAIARLWFTVLNSDVKPLDNLDCRKAVLYAADHESYLKAYGGSASGKIATTLLPAQIPGAPKTDPYGFNDKPNGDIDKAKAALVTCGHPEGFSVNVSYRSDRPKEKAVAEGLQQSLGKVGIKLELKGFPTGDYTKLYAGKPEYAKANNIGLAIYGWGADWTDGFGFLQQIVDSRVIRPAGNTNLGVKDPAVDALIDKALVTTDAAARNKIWGDVDTKVMEDAYILPGVWSSVVLYRGTRLTNVGISEGLGGFYDYVQLGVQ